jgi:hypothetical protein
MWMSVFFLILANLLLFVAYFWLAHTEPVVDLRMGVNTQGLVIRGKNQLGFMRFKVFNNWQEAESYMDSHHYSMPQILDVPTLPPREVIQQGSALIWRVPGNKTFTLRTPNTEVAEILLPFVKYHVLEASSLGYSIPLSTN